MRLRPVFCDLIAQAIKGTLNLPRGRCDQHQSNGSFCIHQLRTQLPGDPTIYRIVIAPADAPLHIGNIPIDAHFAEPIRLGLDPIGEAIGG